MTGWRVIAAGTDEPPISLQFAHGIEADEAQADWDSDDDDSDAAPTSPHSEAGVS